MVKTTNQYFLDLCLMNNINITLGFLISLIYFN